MRKSQKKSFKVVLKIKSAQVWEIEISNFGLIDAIIDNSPERTIVCQVFNGVKISLKIARGSVLNRKKRKKE
jgi:hypothetical protein